MRLVPNLLTNRAPAAFARYLLGALAVLLAVMAAYLSFAIQQRQNALSNISGSDLSWAAAQAAVELTRFGQVLGGQIAGPGSSRDVQLRYDLLISRLRLLHEGREYRSFFERDPANELLFADVQARVAALEPLVGEPANREALRQALQAVEQLAPQIVQLAATANNFAASSADAERRELFRLHWAFSAVSAALVFVGMMQLLTLARHNRILERTRQELALQNRRFDAAIRNIPHGIAMFAADERLVVFNGKLAEMLGLSKSLKAGVRLADLKEHARREGAGDRSLVLENLGNQQQSSEDFATIELGGGRFLHIIRTPMAGGGWVSTVEDISERRAAEDQRQRLEAQLRQAQKMEAVGQLTGGIAHDFNNLLTVILGSAEVLVEEKADAARTQALSSMILEAAERGADLTEKLLAFGRRQSLNTERVDVNEVVQGMTPLLERTIGEHVELRSELPPGQPPALTDRTLLESAILNLVVNARDAMPGGGTVTIRSGHRTVKAGSAGAGPDKRMVSVTVQDTGSGIPPEVLEHVFEPFFTTKEVGKGSGLGLSMVYGFAQQSGGQVLIESSEGVGTSVTILLPAGAEQPVEVRGPEILAAPDAVAAKGRILLVEDEAPVLKFVSSLLQGLGYQVKSVANGPDALAILAAEEFDLLLTDVVLPKGITGIELAERARSLRPAMKVLLTSGYPEEAFARSGTAASGFALLRKPYRRNELAQAVHDALATPMAASPALKAAS